MREGVIVRAAFLGGELMGALIELGGHFKRLRGRTTHTHQERGKFLVGHGSWSAVA